MNGDRNLSWADQCGANQDLKGILIAVSQMFHLFDFFYSGHMCDQAISFTNLLLRAIPAFASNIQVRASPMKSEETTSSSV